VINRVFDIHNHILWGVDDGSESLAMSIHMLKMAAETGTTDIILTPHNKPNRRNIYADEMERQIDELREHIKQQDIDINVYPGNEIYYRIDVADRIKIGKATTMAGSRYVLLEFDPMDEWNYIRRGADDIMAEGFIPIIAHVERYENVTKDIDRARTLKKMGCYLQLNASSVVGKVGWDYKRKCKSMLKEGLVSFIASDAHEDKTRVPTLDKCIKYVSRKYGEEFAEEVFSVNPQMILEDKII